MTAGCMVVLMGVLWYPMGACAAAPDPGPPMLVFSGFGTLGLVHSSEDRADFTTSVFQPNGAGYTHAWSPDVDRRFGAQLVANFSPQVSAMLQVISEQRYDNTYRPHIEWANVKYQVTPAFSVRVGRVVLPSFMVSDTRNVGFANPWVRPPPEVYGIVPLTTNDGANATYTAHLGKVNYTLVASYGVNNEDSVQGGKAKTRRQLNLSNTIEMGQLTVRLTYQQAHLTIDAFNPFLDTFRQFGAQGSALADRYDQHEKPLWFAGIGAMYDPGGWFVTGEWGVTEFHSVLGRNMGWYLSAGHRWARITPYLTYAQVKGESNKSDPGLDLAGLPPALAGQAAGLNAGLNSILGAAADQKTASLGVRWDFTKNMDLKVQYDRLRLGAGSPGTLSNLQPNFQPGGTVNLVSVAIDFVF